MKTDFDAIYRILNREVRTYRVPVVDLVKVQTDDPFKVLVATILSARTKDEQTVRACRKLFSKVSNAKDLEKLTVKEIEKLIFPVGFFHNKARYLKELPKALDEMYSGRIPQTVDELIKLPGVGRKTANLVVVIAFGKPAVCVDIHVHRIMNRLGYVRTKNPFETEMALRKKLPKKYWITFNSILVAFGQFTCTPVSPFCSRCPVEKYCKKVGVGRSR
jgi:endonuclease III